MLLPHLIDEMGYQQALQRVDALWDAAPGSAEEEELYALAEQVERYERAHRKTVLPPPRPGVLIAYKLRELGWSQRKLAQKLGWPSGRVSEVISGKRRLTLDMVRALAPALGVDPGALVASDDAEHVLVRVDAQLARAALDRGLLGADSLDSWVNGQLRAALAVRVGLDPRALSPPVTVVMRP